MAENPKRSSNANQLAKFIVDTATGAIPLTDLYEGKNPTAVELGWLGGKKGATARAKRLPDKQRKEIVQKVAQARYGKKPD